MSTRIPHLLEPYLALPPEAALILLTSVLGASSNWLVLRFLYSHLKTSPEIAGSEIATHPTDGGTVGVALVSFMRDGAFWRDGAGRMGLELEAMNRGGRFVFVDGLTGLFSGREDGLKMDGGSGGVLTGRSDKVLRSAKVREVEAGIMAALGQLRTGRKILIIDQMDVLLAASEDDVTSTALSGMLVSLRESIHSTLLTLSADHPLLHAQTTMLEREHESLVLGQAHAADRVFALRMLDTGTAKDVSGVVRITRGGGAVDDDDGQGIEDDEGREFLYHIAPDGGVRVFERGS